LAALLAPGLVAGQAGAHSHEKGTLVIGHLWSRPVASDRPVAVAYLSITNNGSVAETLTGASMPLAGTTVPLTLIFRIKGSVTVPLNIEERATAGRLVGHALAARLDDPLQEEQTDQRHESDH
jgi:copper(I)-binding protein